MGLAQKASNPSLDLSCSDCLAAIRSLLATDGLGFRRHLPLTLPAGDNTAHRKDNPALRIVVAVGSGVHGAALSSLMAAVVACSWMPADEAWPSVEMATGICGAAVGWNWRPASISFAF